MRTTSRTVVGRTKHATVVFTLTALVASYAALGLMILVDRGLLPGRSIPSQIGWDMEEASSLVLVLVLLATTFSMTRLTEGTAGVRALIARMTRWRVGWRWWLTVAAAVPAATVGLAVALGDHVVWPTPMTFVNPMNCKKTAYKGPRKSQARRCSGVRAWRIHFHCSFTDCPRLRPQAATPRR